MEKTEWILMAPYKIRGDPRLFISCTDIYRDRRCCQMQEKVIDPCGGMYGVKCGEV